MKELFAFSYVLIWGLVVLEAVVLQEVLRRTVWFKRLYAGFYDRAKRQYPSIDALAPGALAPEFTARMLGREKPVSTFDMKGHSTILLFVSPKEASSPLYGKLSAGIHALWHKAGGNLYLVCGGGEEECRRMGRNHGGQGVNEGHVPVILDEEARIARSFLIRSTPQAVMLDEDLRVSRYGYPLPTEEAADGE